MGQAFTSPAYAYYSTIVSKTLQEALRFFHQVKGLWGVADAKTALTTESALEACYS
jgi:hypothetical protein